MPIDGGDVFSTFMAGGIRLSQALRRMSPDSAHTCREPVRQRTHFHRQSKLLCRLMGRAEAEHVLGRGWRRRHMIIAWKPGTISISVPCFSAGSTHQQHSPAAPNAFSSTLDLPGRKPPRPPGGLSSCSGFAELKASTSSNPLASRNKSSSLENLEICASESL